MLEFFPVYLTFFSESVFLLDLVEKRTGDSKTALV